MIEVFPTIEGEKQKRTFKTSWAEVSIDDFIKWNDIAKKMYSVEEKAEQNAVRLKAIAKKASARVLAGKNANVYLKPMKKLNNKIEALKEEIHLLSVEGVSIFVDISVADLLAMKRTKSFEFDQQDLNDDCIELYKLRLSILAAEPFPSDSVSEFYFQSETDEIIEELQSKYIALNFIQKFRKKGKDLKRRIQKAKNAKYKIIDLWKQTTTTNQEFQSIANDLISEMKEGDFSGLPFLLAYCTVEGSEDSKILEKIKNEGGARSYIEKYNAEFKELYSRRVEIFTKQKKKLSFADCIRIRNFFLSS